MTSLQVSDWQKNHQAEQYRAQPVLLALDALLTDAPCTVCWTGVCQDGCLQLHSEAQSLGESTPFRLCQSSQMLCNEGSPLTAFWHLACCGICSTCRGPPPLWEC